MKNEVQKRIAALCKEVDSLGKDWDAIFIVDKVNQYYLTGTMQDGIFVVKRDGTYAYFARRSFERAQLECVISEVYQMSSYREVAKVIGTDVHNIYVESEVITHAMLERIKKYFEISNIYSVDKSILNVRAVKSEYELSFIEESGRQHQKLLDDVVPGLLREGMNEAQLTASIFDRMIGLGYHGIARFSMFQAEIVVGQIGFGENTLYPTSFDGPGGMKGMHPAAPVIGDRQRLLGKGDLVFVDIGYGYCGYHTDKTQVYMFGGSLPAEAEAAHLRCIEIQKQAAQLLKPGNIPSDIYSSITSTLDSTFLQNFMGYGARKVKFLGHGVGLRIDEYPVIANGFNQPLCENMIVALEPKIGIKGVGTVGVEDTYIVTPNGGKCITGGGTPIKIV